MERIFHDRRDLMLEAMSYLHLLAGDPSLEAVLSRLEMLYAQAGNAPIIKKRLEAVRSLADALAKEYTPDMKDLEKFFRPFSVGQGSLAQVLIFSFYEPLITGWEDQVQSIQKKFAEFAAGESPSLAQLNLSRIFDDSNTDSKEASRPLVEQLEETGLSDAEKWQLLRVIHDAGPYLEQLTHILLPVKSLIEANLPAMEPLLLDFADRWQAYFEKTSFASFLSDNIGIEAGDLTSFTLHVYPSIFECGTIMLSMEAEEKTVYMQIGICLQEGVNVKALPMESYLLLEGLKALSDKSKLNILTQIRDKRSYGQALARETGLSTATISHHMSALINCGFIHMERVENRIYYQMDKENLRKFLHKLTLYLLSGEGTDA